MRVAARAGDSSGKYKGVVDCFVRTMRDEGPLAFYKGFIPNFGRLGSWNVAMFLTLEQVGRPGGLVWRVRDKSYAS
jgi:solute carrier family 25 uncoupling protein 8/9